jgi:hypothetical protein
MHDAENLRPSDWVGLILVLLLGLGPVLVALVFSWWLLVGGGT